MVLLFTIESLFALVRIYDTHSRNAIVSQELENLHIEDSYYDGHSFSYGISEVANS